MRKYIDAGTTLQHLTDRLMESALNNVGIKADADEVFCDIAKNRLPVWMDELQTHDVVEVVRCENCKWLEKWHKELPPYDTGLYCTRPNQQSTNLLPTDYCSYGERKDG